MSAANASNGAGHPLPAPADPTNAVHCLHIGFAFTTKHLKPLTISRVAKAAGVNTETARSEHLRLMPRPPRAGAFINRRQWLDSSQENAGLLALQKPKTVHLALTRPAHAGRGPGPQSECPLVDALERTPR